MDKRFVADRIGWQILHGDTSGVAFVLHVEFEFSLLHLICTKRINVFHHQVPVGKLWRHSAALQHFYKQSLTGVSHIARELTHLVHLSLIRVFISHGEHLVGIERRVERNVAQRRIELVLRRRQQAGTLDFLIVAAALYAVGRQRLKRRRHLAYLTRVGIFGFDFLHKVVGIVAWIVGRYHRHPVVVLQVFVLTHIHKPHQMARLVVRAPLVGYPHLNTCDIDTRKHIRQLRGIVVVCVAEIVPEEEISVFVVVVGID